MPLVSGNSQKAVSQNIAIERHHGKPEDQAVAIAMSEAEKSKDAFPEPVPVKDFNPDAGERGMFYGIEQEAKAKKRRAAAKKAARTRKRRRAKDALPLPVPVGDAYYGYTGDAPGEKKISNVERLVLKLMRAGRTSADIAEELGMDRRKVITIMEDLRHGGEDEGTVTWKTLPKPVHVSKPLQSVALKPGEEKEVYRPRTDKELSSSFGKDDARVMTSIELRDEIRAVRSQISGSAGIMLKRENPERYKQLESHLTDLLDASSYRSKDALPLPVPVKDDRQPLGGLKCQKCGKSVSEKTRQLGGPPLCALHRAIASGSARDDEDGSTFVRAAEKTEQTKQWARASSMYRLAQRAFINQGLMEQAAMAREDADRCAVSWTKAKARDAAPRYKPTDCIYNPPS